MAHLHLSFEQPLDMRINEFKNDPEKMKDINDFLNDMIEKARIEAESKQHKGRLESLGIQNGSKRIGASITKAKTSARTFATRVFTAICNCTNTVKSAVVNRN